MPVIRSRDVPSFLAVAGSWLETREAAHNLIFGISADLEADPSLAHGTPYLATVVDGDRVVAAAIRTPPWNLVLAEADDAAALAPLVEDAIDAAGAAGLPGVIGPAGTVDAFATAWSSHTGGRARLEMRERIFELSAVTPPIAQVPGAMRLAGPMDRNVLIDWLVGFDHDAFGDRPQAESSATRVDRWLAGSKALHLWVDGEPVSLCGVGGPTPHGIRIGPVYTPPDRRGHGYASALVAAASQAELDAGRRFCFLLTDLANPTSNHIYQSIGYRPVRDVAVFALGPRGREAPDDPPAEDET